MSRSAYVDLTKPPEGLVDLTGEDEAPRFGNKRYLESTNSSSITVDDLSSDEDVAERTQGCLVCHVIKPYSQFHELECSHSFCGVCLRAYVHDTLRSELALEVPCPLSSCWRSLSLNNVMDLSLPQDFLPFLRRHALQFIRRISANYITCTSCNEQTPLHDRRTGLNAPSEEEIREGKFVFMCWSCMSGRCRACGNEEHHQQLQEDHQHPNRGASEGQGHMCSQDRSVVLHGALCRLAAATSTKNSFDSALVEENTGGEEEEEEEVASDDDAGPEDQYGTWTVHRLKAELKSRNIQFAAGRKADLLARLREAAKGDAQAKPQPQSSSTASSSKSSSKDKHMVRKLKKKMLQQSMRYSSRSTLAKGTGYGGAQDEAVNLLRSQANEERQKQEDEQVASSLTSLTRSLPSASRPFQVDATFAGLLLTSCLLPVMCAYFRNDSFFDISNRSTLYMALFLLAQTLLSQPLLLPLLEIRDSDKDGDDTTTSSSSSSSSVPHDAGAADKSGGSSNVNSAVPSSSSSSSSSAAPSELPSMEALLEQLNKQAEVFIRGASSVILYADDQSGSQLLALAKCITDTYTNLKDGICTWRRQRETSRLRHKGIWVQSNIRSKRRRRKRPRLVAAPVGSKTDEKAYCDTLQPLQFDSRPLTSNGFFYINLLHRAVSSSAPSKRLLRISQELSALSTSLPLAAGSGIFLRTDETRLDCLAALITGPAGTPYQNGCFEFHIFLPEEYPRVPPQVHFMTTGSGMAHFNPNLYPDGKVCLSLLGTWQGPGWVPNKSTILQVLISIQSLIMNSDPWYNEPGRENLAGKQASEEYNHSIRALTMQYAILDQIRRPSLAFAEVIRSHFALKRGEILSQCATWVAEGRGRYATVTVATLVEAELSKLCDQPKQEPNASEVIVL